MTRARLLLGCALLCATAPAHAAPADDLVRKLDAAAHEVQSLAGDFTQRNRLKLFKQELRSRGRFFFQRPRRIRWEYLDPDPSTLVLDGQTATLRTPGAAPQVFDLARDATMRAIFDQLLLWLGSGALAQAGGEYDLSAGGTGAEPALLLAPKAGGQVARAFLRIELRVDGKTLLLKSILLVEKNGDEKEITFTRLVRNTPPPADAFR